MTVSTANQTLADNLRALMEEAGLKQKGLEARCGVKQTTISLYLRPEDRTAGKDGKAGSAKLTEVEQIAQAFGLQAWELLRPQGAGGIRAENEFERQLLDLFRKIPPGEKDTVLAMVNGLANITERASGRASVADPYPHVPPPPTATTAPRPPKKANAKPPVDAGH